MRLGHLRFDSPQFVILVLWCGSMIDDWRERILVTASDYRQLVSHRSYEIYEALGPSTGHAYISSNEVKQDGAGHAKMDADPTWFSIDRPMLKSRHTEPDRPKKTLVRAAGCQEGGDSGCLRGGKRVRTHTENSKTTSDTNNDSTQSEMPPAYKSQPGKKHSSKESQNASHSSKSSKSKAKSAKSSKQMTLDSKSEKTAPKSTRTKTPESSSHAAKKSLTSPISGSTEDLPMPSQTPHTTAPPTHMQEIQLKPQTIQSKKSGGSKEKSSSNTYSDENSAVSILGRIKQKHKSHSSTKDSGTASNEYDGPNEGSRKSKRPSDGSTSGPDGGSIVSTLINTPSQTSSKTKDKENKESHRDSSSRSSHARESSAKSGSEDNANGESIVSILINTKENEERSTPKKQKSKASNSLISGKHGSKKLKHSDGIKVSLHHSSKSSSSQISMDIEESEDSSGGVKQWLDVLNEKGSNVSKSSRGGKGKGSKTKSSESKSTGKGRRKKKDKVFKKKSSKSTSSSKPLSASPIFTTTTAPIFSSPIFSPQTQEPTVSPVLRETSAPVTAPPTVQPVIQASPTTSPIDAETSAPSVSTTNMPTLQPSSQPTLQPSSQPTENPTENPTVGVTASPSSAPSAEVSASPTSLPTQGTDVPSVSPSAQPSNIPTISPVTSESEAPSAFPEPPTDAPITEAPTQRPVTDAPITEAPTRAPVTPAPVTEAPTAQGQVNASPFNVMFVATGDPTEKDLLAAGEVTLQYLEDYFTVQFDFNSATQLRAVDGMVVGADIAQSLAEIDVSLIFSGDSLFIPSSSDIDNMLFTAFEVPFVDGLLTLLGSELPSGNPLSSTSMVVYSLRQR